MLVANPITNRKIQAIKMHRDGPRWRLEKLPDFVSVERPMVPPRRDHLRPRRLPLHRRLVQQDHLPQRSPAEPSRARQNPRPHLAREAQGRRSRFDVPDFTKLTGDELIAKLGGASLAQSHLAWQALADRKRLAPGTVALLKQIALGGQPGRTRVARSRLSRCNTDSGGVGSRAFQAVDQAMVVRLIKNRNPSVAAGRRIPGLDAAAGLDRGGDRGRNQHAGAKPRPRHHVLPLASAMPMRVFLSVRKSSSHSGRCRVSLGCSTRHR